MIRVHRSVLAILTAVILTEGVTAWAGSRPMTGQVTDATGAALPGTMVSATVDGASAADVATDEAGRFRIELPEGRIVTLTFRAPNFATTTRTFDAARLPGSLDVTLELSLTAEVTVVGQRTFRQVADALDPASSLMGIARAASDGAVTPAEIVLRPVQRVGEVLEAVPGLVVSQHTGEGKANQYYLRGFNLDHGTDFATSVAGLPVNLPTHAHGHGYTDANFVIPELIGGIQFSKGGYDAGHGDFSAAGTASVRYLNVLDSPTYSVSAGAGGWRRMLAAASPRMGAGHLLGAIEVATQDGPWTRPDDYRRTNGLLRYSARVGRHSVALTGLAYSGRWNGTDQIPARAVSSGAIGRFDGIDTTTGGDTSRQALIGEWQRAGRAGTTTAAASVQRYDLDLFSNFTYFLDDPEHGDQFHQADRRWIGNARVTHQAVARVGGRALDWRIGGETRHDAIGLVGLYKTSARRRLSTVREDAVDQTSAGVFADAEVEVGSRLRATGGLRADVFRFDVRAARADNSGVRMATLLSPKAGLVMGPWRGTELYVNAGLGYHSNDARGVTATVEPVTPLVRARSGEIGVRTVAIPRTQITAAVWGLSLASEQRFVGDAGTTEAGRPSRRAGIELAAFSRIAPWLAADADLAWTSARFADDAPAGSRIPGAVSAVADVGLTVPPSQPVFGSLRLRVLGRRPLVEDGSLSSNATRLVNGRVGVRLGSRYAMVLDAFNLFDARDSDIDYVYTSRLPGEDAAGVDDRHFHPALPRSIRLLLTTSW